MAGRIKKPDPLCKCGCGLVAKKQIFNGMFKGWSKYYEGHAPNKHLGLNLTPSQRSMRWQKKHPEKVAEYKVRNKDRIRAFQKNWVNENREKMRAYHNDRYHRLSKDPEVRKKNSERVKKYYRLNPDKFKVRAKEYAQENQDKVRAWKRVQEARRRGRKFNAGGDFTKQQWAWRLEFYGNRCAYCDIELSDKTTHMDHQIPISKGGSSWPSNLVPACNKCNLKKHNRSPFEFQRKRRKQIGLPI